MFEEYAVVGDSSKNLLLKGKGQVKIQWGNKFIDLIKDGKINTGVLQINTVKTINDIGKINGFYYVESNSSVYVVINSEIIPIVDGENSSYVSYLEQSNINDAQRLQALKNIGFIYSTKAELYNLKFNNSIVYCQEDQQLYIINNGTVTKFNSTITVHATTSDEATKLSNTRNIWGQPFNGTKDITGDQTINGSSNIYGDQKIKGNLQTDGSLQIGNFQESILGSGARVLANGAAEFESIYARSSISAPEFTFNRITVSYGESWCTNGYGTIKDVIINDDKLGGTVYVKIDDGDFMSVEVGDICRGIFSDGISKYDTSSGTLDINGFEKYNLVFTSYFTITSVNYATNSFVYKVSDTTIKHPCKYMKFAQYGNILANSTRCSSIYTNTLNHPYTICLDKVGQYFSTYNYTGNETYTEEQNQLSFNPFTIYPYNIVKIDGYLGGRKINIQDGTKELQGYGLYVQNNVYLGGALIEFDAQTLASIQNKTETVLTFDKVISLNTDSANKVSEDFTLDIPVTLKIGGIECSNLAVSTLPDYITFNSEQKKFIVNITKDTVLTKQTIPFTITGTYKINNINYTCTVNDVILIIPNKSSLGLYDMGDYSNVTAYTNDGQWSPIVKYNNDYYYLYYIGTITGETPITDSLYWKQISRTDAIYSNILLANFAKIGNAVFTGNYMISQTGKINGVSSTNYQQFNPDDLSSSTAFIPNFYINLVTGKITCSDINVTGGILNIGTNFAVDYDGNITANSGIIGGWNLNSNGLYYGDITKWDITSNETNQNLASFTIGQILLERWKGYGDTATQKIKIGLGEGSTKVISDGNSNITLGAAYIYRKFGWGTISMAYRYYPAVEIVSDNSALPDVALRTTGAIVCNGGNISNGYIFEISESNPQNLIDFSYGTSVLVYNTYKYVYVNLPSLNSIQLLLGNTKSFVIPFSVTISYNSTANIDLRFQTGDSTLNFLDKDGHSFGSSDRILMGISDTVQMLLIYDSTNYYAQVLSYYK